MGGEDDCAAEPGEVAAEPVGTVGIEVIGRLVEHEHIRLGQQEPGQAEPGQLAAADPRQRQLVGQTGQAELRADGRHPAFRGPAAEQ
jgi:hypothetical protein